MTKQWYLVLALTLLSSALALAEEYEISSHSMHSKDDITEFRGNVQVSGSDVQVHADVLSVNANTSLYNLAGTPAVMVLIRNAVTVTISAAVIDYDAHSSAVTLSGNSMIQRGALEVNAEQLEYHAKADRIIARDAVKLREADMEAAGNIATIRALRGTVNLALFIKGTPATFRAVRAGKTFAATANSIEYSRRKRLVELRGAAAANYDGEILKGEAIIYDLEQGSFAATPGSSGQRVTAVITLP